MNSVFPYYLHIISICHTTPQQPLLALCDSLQLSHLRLEMFGYLEGLIRYAQLLGSVGYQPRFCIAGQTQDLSSCSIDGERRCRCQNRCKDLIVSKALKVIQLGCFWDPFAAFSQPISVLDKVNPMNLVSGGNTSQTSDPPGL